MFSQNRYPFEHARGCIYLAEYLFDVFPSEEDLPGILRASGLFLDRMSAFRSRLVGELALMAEAAEGALGARPLEPPATGKVREPAAPKPAGG